MSQPLTVRVLAGALLFALACATPAEPSGRVAVIPERTAFVRAPGEPPIVVYTVENSGAVPVLLTSRCGDHLAPAIEHRTSAGWTQFAGGICPAINMMSPVPLAPGQSRQDAVTVAEVGVYRLVIGTDRGAAMSAAFTVR